MSGKSKLFDYDSVTRPGSRGSEGPSVSEIDSTQSESGFDGLAAGSDKRPAARSSSGPAKKAPTSDRSLGAPRVRWVIKRGHSISFAGLFLFTAVLYFRPYEHSPALSWTSTSAYWIALLTLVVFFPAQLALEGNLTARPSEVSLVLLLTLMALMSIPLAISPAEAWKTFNDSFVKVVVMFIVMVNVVRTKWRLNALIYLATAVSVLLSVIAINDYRLGRLELRGVRIEGSIGGMFQNPNDLAMYLVIIVPVVFALAVSSRSLLLRILWAVIGLLMVSGIVVTFSRGGFLALVAGLGLLAFKLGRSRRLMVGVIAAIALIAFLAFAPGDYMGRVATIVNSSRDSSGSSGAREQLLVRSVLVTLRHPLLGVGMGNFHFHSIREQVTHNSYTQVGAEMGIPAMLLYTMFIIAPYRKLRRIERETLKEKRNTTWHYYFAVGLQCSLVAYLIGSYFSSIAYLWYLYYLVGYSICLRRIYFKDDQAAVSS